MIIYQKARIFDPDWPTNRFYVQFNPNTLEYSAGVSEKSDKHVAGSGGPGTQRELESQGPLLANERGARLSVRLFFHSYNNDQDFSDVRPGINRIRAFLPAVSGSETTSRKITFAWGTLTHTGTLESFNVTYQMFAFDGTPVQAEVSITIRGEDPDVSAAFGNEALPNVSGVILTQQNDVPSRPDLLWLFL